MMMFDAADRETPFLPHLRLPLKDQTRFELELPRTKMAVDSLLSLNPLDVRFPSYRQEYVPLAKISVSSSPLLRESPEQPVIRHTRAPAHRDDSSSSSFSGSLDSNDAPVLRVTPHIKGPWQKDVSGVSALKLLSIPVKIAE